MRMTTTLVVVDTGALVVAPSDDSNFVLLRDTVFELVVECPAKSESAHGWRARYKLVDVV